LCHQFITVLIFSIDRPSLAEADWTLNLVVAGMPQAVAHNKQDHLKSSVRMIELRGRIEF